MYWYNPKIRVSESVPAPRMPIEQALIFVGHHFRMWHLRFQPTR